MFAPEWRPDHAGDAKVGLVKLPQGKELVDDFLLLGDAVELWNKPRVINHSCDVKVRYKPIEHHEDKVEDGVRAECRCWVLV